MKSFRNPTISPGTRLGYVSSHPFGLSNWMQWTGAHAERRVMTPEELQGRNARGASVAELAARAQTVPRSASAPRMATGMALRDAQRRRWHAEKALNHMTADMQYLGAETSYAQQILKQYAEANSVKSNDASRFLQVTMPMTGGPANWREELKKDGVAQAIPQRSIPVPIRGNGQILEHGAVPTVNQPDGTFRIIRPMPSGTFEHDRFIRSIPSGYAGFIPNHIRELNEPARAPRVFKSARE